MYETSNVGTSIPIGLHFLTLVNKILLGHWETLGTLGTYIGVMFLGAINWYETKQCGQVATIWTILEMLMKALFETLSNAMVPIIRRRHAWTSSGNVIRHVNWVHN